MTLSEWQLVAQMASLIIRFAFLVQVKGARVQNTRVVIRLLVFQNRLPLRIVTELKNASVAQLAAISVNMTKVYSHAKNALPVILP